MVCEEIIIKGNAVSSIIGAQGATIKKLMDELSVKLRFLGDNSEQYTERKLEISGLSHLVENAKRRIIDITEGRDPEVPIKNGLNIPNRYSSKAEAMTRTNADGITPNSVTSWSEFLVPLAIAPYVLGPDNENLQSIKKTQNLRCIEPGTTRILDNGREMLQIVIRGPVDGVNNALKLLRQLTDAGKTGAKNEIVDLSFLANTQRNPQERRPNTIAVNERLNGNIVSQENDDLLNGQNSKGEFSVDVSNFAIRINALSEQHKHEVERVSRMHCDEIVRAALEYVARAERVAQNEIRSIRERYAQLKSELDTARANAANGGGIYGLEIVNLRNQLSSKEEQLQSLLADNEQYKASVEDLKLEIGSLKFRHKQQQSRMCKKCKKQPIDALLLPCFHLTYCISCAESVKVCEINSCNTSIITSMKVNF